jgi:hypothetical protein
MRQGSRLGTSGHGTLQQMWERACSRIGPQGIRVRVSSQAQPGIKVRIPSQAPKKQNQTPKAKNQTPKTQPKKKARSDSGLFPAGIRHP